MAEKLIKIMIADDDDGILDAVGLMLSYKGFEIVTCQEPSVQAIHAANPDILLLDIWMAGEDGISICKQLKACNETASIPVLMISASKDIERSARNAGANDFLPKPFEMSELVLKIEALYQQHTGISTSQIQVE